MITNHCVTAPAATNCLPTWELRQLSPASGEPGGTLTITLDHGYRLEICEGSSQIRIVNSGSEESTTIWGDPQGGWHDRDGGRCAGTACFVLADNTRITISTRPGPQGGEARPTSLVITRGEASMIVDGLSADAPGALRIHQGRQGHALERLLSDGRAVFVENTNGIGWQSGRSAGDPPLSAGFSPVARCSTAPRPPMLCQQLATMYHGCEPPRPPVPADTLPSHAGKHGYGVHHGKHGYGVHHGKHGHGVHHGKHGFGMHHGRDVCGVHHGKHGASVHHGKHGYSVHHGKHRGRC